MRRKGSCLCGTLTYEIEGRFDGVWMCHCSNCRKASGGMGNTIIVVPRERFHWLSGEEHRVSYALRSSYSITRCKTCGTPLPAEEDDNNVYLTAGTLDEPLDAGVKNHIFYKSRADWERDADNVRYFEERESGPRMGTAKKTVWVIRHAESEANAGAKSDDPATIPLTARGQSQALALVQRFPKVPELIITSPFVRTAATAAPLCARYPQVPQETWPIEEYTYLAPARCVGMDHTQRRPMVDEYWRRLDPGWVDGEGAESYSAFCQRVHSFRKMIVEREETFVAVFTHGQFIQGLLFSMLVDEPARSMASFLNFMRSVPVENTARFVLEVEPDRLPSVRRLYNRS